MNFTNGSSNVCHNVKHDEIFILLSLILLIITMINLYANLILFKTFHSTVRFIYLPNVRLILTNFCIANTICSVCFLIRLCYHFVLIAYDFHTFEMTRILCLIFETPFMVSMSCLSVSLMALGVERFLVTAFDYSTASTFAKRFSKVFVNITWLIGAMNVAMVLSSFKSMSDQRVCYCYALLAIPEMDLKQSLSGYVALQFLVGFCCIYIYAKSKIRLQSTCNISRFNKLKERHERFLNITSSKSFLPNVGSGAALLTVAAFGDILNHKFYWSNPQDILSVNYIIAGMIFLMFVCLLQVCLFLKNDENIKKMTNEKFQQLIKLIDNVESSYDHGGNRIIPLNVTDLNLELTENGSSRTEITLETWNDIWERATLKLY